MTDDKKIPHFSDGLVTESCTKSHSDKDRNIIFTLISAAKNRLSGMTPKEATYIVAEFIFEHPRLVMGSLALILVGVLLEGQQPLTGNALLIFKATYALGTVWLVASVMAQTQKGIANGTHLGPMFSDILERFVFLQVALTSLSAYSPKLADMITSAQANPSSVLAIASGALIVIFMHVLTPTRNREESTSTHTQSTTRQAISSAPIALSEKDIYRTSVHEAGHLLMFSNSKNLPTKLSVSVAIEAAPHEQYRGNVFYSDQSMNASTQSQLHWVMLMNLSGFAAESIVLGEPECGSMDDNRKWMATACYYLSAGFGETFFPEPEGGYQIAHNRAILNELKRSCLAELNAFLKANRGLLEELAAQIANWKTMDSDQIAPYLARVAAADTLPKAPIWQ